MKYTEKEIKKGIKLHVIKNGKFKTNLIAIFLTTPITKKDVTANALISAVLRRGSKNMHTSAEISKTLEEMYGATFDNGIDKMGDNQILKFYIETINDNFIPHNGENMLKTSIEKLVEIVFNPLIINNHFNEEYVKQEKDNIRRIIEGKTDNKAFYSTERCIEEMYKNQVYGLYKYGYIEDLEKINATNLYEQYKDLISNSKIDIFVSGNIDENIEKILEENESMRMLKDREGRAIYKLEKKEKVEEHEVIEEMDVVQGKVVIGMDLDINDEKQKYDAIVYNAILGGTANSKMFQEVREKASLAYTAGSIYSRYKNNIFIKCGIEIKNYKKALEIIKKQLEDMRNGNFTEEDIKNAKKSIISGIKSVVDEQDTEITYYFGQEITNIKISLDEYIQKIESVTKEKIIEIAKLLEINTIYFLKNKEEQECK